MKTKDKIQASMLSNHKPYDNIFLFAELNYKRKWQLCINHFVAEKLLLIRF